MDPVILIGLGVGVLAICAFFYLRLGKAAGTSGSLQDIISHQGGLDPREIGAEGSIPEEMLKGELILAKKRDELLAKQKSSKDEVADRFFKAGIYSEEHRKKVHARLLAARIGLPVAFIGGGLFMGLSIPLLVCTGCIGMFVGVMYAGNYLDRAIKRRYEETMYHLPLVIEQIAIGVSSSLDIGPCIGMVTSTATERGTHNTVTEMLVHVEKLLRSGMNLEDALIEVGTASGFKEIKHAFNFLGSCAKHGGEISKQLQELADSVMMQRQLQIEEIIHKLPVKASGPLFLVFAGFMAVIFTAVFQRIIQQMAQ